MCQKDKTNINDIYRENNFTLFFFFRAVSQCFPTNLAMLLPILVLN